MKTLLYGSHPVSSLIKAYENGSREIYNIYTSRPDFIIPPSLKSITSQKTSHELSALVPGKNHQGIICVCNRAQNNNLSDLLDAKRLIILDGIKDPQNMGAIIRSAANFGVDGIIFPKDGSANPFTNPSVAKASCGMLDFMPLCEVVNISRTITELKNYNFWTVGADASGNMNLADFVRTHGSTEKLVIIMGSEESGMKKNVKNMCDFLVNIPMIPHAESLNASVSAGIFMYALSNLHSQ